MTKAKSYQRKFPGSPPYKAVQRKSTTLWIEANLFDRLKELSEWERASVPATINLMIELGYAVLFNSGEIDRLQSLQPDGPECRLFRGQRQRGTSLTERDLMSHILNTATPSAAYLAYRAQLHARANAIRVREGLAPLDDSASADELVADEQRLERMRVALSRGEDISDVE